MNRRRAVSKGQYGALLARIILGGIFIYTGLVKAMHPVEFLKMVRQYEVVTDYTALNFISAVLPWFEIFCGLLLLGGIAVHGVALNVAAMLVPFTILVTRHALQLASAKQLAFCAVEFNCGCGTGEVNICKKILENAGLLILTFIVLARPFPKFALRFNLLNRPPMAQAAAPPNGRG